LNLQKIRRKKTLISSESDSSGYSSYLDPRHVVLLHLFHLQFDGRVKFVFELQ
jgi:hypothetical protein